MIEQHTVLGHEAWLEARQNLLAKEKAFSRLRDELSKLQRELPWERVDANYVFDGPGGQRSLGDLFDGRAQLIVYHFMFDPDWEEGCEHCSFWADNFDPNVVHLNARDVSMVAVSLAPYPKLAAYQRRMGWTFNWFSSFGTSFNFDYGVSFTADEQATEGFYNYRMQPEPSAHHAGVSVFYKNHEGLFHTYSTYARGIDMFNAAYNYLDVVPAGRGEEGHHPQYWVRRHDEYPG